jgi:hypothetical protein
LEDNENYFLEYSHSPDDSTPSQSFSLINCNIKISVENTFMLSHIDDVLLTLRAENGDEMKSWIRTIENVIAVANAREKALGNLADDDDDNNAADSSLNHSKSELRNMLMASKSAGRETQSDNTEQRSKSVFTRPHLRLFPSVRLDVDADSIPPSSTDRHNLLEKFVADVASALAISNTWVDIISVKPAPGMDWLTLVEFDINVPMVQMEEGEENDYEYIEALQAERVEMRSKLLMTLKDLVCDQSSALYNGIITCKLDPSFAENMVDAPEDEVKVYSADPKILAILNKYKDIEIPKSAVDVTHFTIVVHFENRMASVAIPNPMVLRKRCCNLWPFEVKQALGFKGTMQELWLDPIALVPRGMPKALSQPIYFEPSVRFHGAPLINASHLKADLAYDVQFEGM